MDINRLHVTYAYITCSYNKSKFHSNMTELCQYNAWRDPPLLKRYLRTALLRPLYFASFVETRSV